MPELPEVETVRRLLESALVGKKLAKVTVEDDSIVFQKVAPTLIESALTGRVVTAAGRKGKTWWLEFEDEPFYYGHLGMAGWVREMGQPTIRLKEHGEAPLDDENGRARFLKLTLESEDGRRIVMTDGRRLARGWLGSTPSTERKIKELGADAFSELPTVEELAKYLSTRKAPIKASLMDQTWLSGIGNWIADEVLYQARIAPQREGKSLCSAEIGQLRKSIVAVIGHAVDSGADETKYPPNWLFHVRWGGSKGKEMHEGHALVRSTVGGRTTAWVPGVQK